MRLMKTAALAALLMGVAGTASASVITTAHYPQLGYANQYLPSYTSPFQGQGVLQLSNVTWNWYRPNLWIHVTPRQTAVPEPATLALLSAGLLGMGLMARRRKTTI